MPGWRGRSGSNIRWFRRPGILVRDTYGIIENPGVGSMLRTGQIGQNVRARIDPATGDILTQALWPIQGCYQPPLLVADRLPTGAVGELDADGYLRNTAGRKTSQESEREYMVLVPSWFGLAENTCIN